MVSNCFKYSVFVLCLVLGAQAFSQSEDSEPADEAGSSKQEEAEPTDDSPQEKDRPKGEDEVEDKKSESEQNESESNNRNTPYQRMPLKESVDPNQNVALPQDI